MSKPTAKTAELCKLAEDYRGNKMGRRSFLRRAFAVSASATVAYSMLDKLENTDLSAQTVTTLAIGEEDNGGGQIVGDPRVVTTLAVGEEDNGGPGNGSGGGSGYERKPRDPNQPQITTLATGEEDVATTLAIGEEDTGANPFTPRFPSFPGGQGGFPTVQPPNFGGIGSGSGGFSGWSFGEGSNFWRR